MKKRTLFLLTLTLSVITLFEFCVTPKYSQVIPGRWKMIQHFTDGVDDTERYKETYDVYAFNFQNDGSYFEHFSFVGMMNSTKGTWRIVDKNQLVLSDDINVRNSRIFKILELSKDKFRFSYDHSVLIFAPIPAGEKIFNEMK